MRRLLFALSPALLSLVFQFNAVPATAQIAPTDVPVRGTVLDATRAPISGARVTAVPEDGSPPTAATTSPRGEFELRVRPGRYALQVAADGFDQKELAITVSGGDATQREFVLRVAGFTDSLTVSGASVYTTPDVTSGTKTTTPLRDVPQSITVITKDFIQDQLMTAVADAVEYVPGVTTHQGENNRDQVIIRGNSSSADFFVNGVRDDVQYYRDLYNLDRMEALKGPNALIFGRGGGGGVVNRVTKEASFMPLRTASFQGGSFGQTRMTTDLDQPLSDKVAVRFNAMYEDSESFRDQVGLERFAVSPTVTITPGERTRVALSYEYLRDQRVADRGITSFAGRPADVDPATFYGNPADSDIHAYVNLISGVIEHRTGNLTLRNKTLVGDYDRWYQNFVPGAANTDATLVSLSAYNNATNRLNVFNQTDVIAPMTTGTVRHTLLAGTEFGRQRSDNFRNTGFFNNVATSVQAPFDNPTISTPVTYRQNATDADNNVKTYVAAAYAQDQIELSPHFQAIAGVRFDRFDLRYLNNRNGDALSRIDNLVSPRAGLVYKPVTKASIYGSYSVSYLPSSGDQFSSLTIITQQVEPEKFTNYEVGVKWDLEPGLALTSAVYRLDRTNTRATDPNDATRIVQTGSQRTKGVELGLSGQISPAWNVAGGYAFQDAVVTSATVAARQGAHVAQVPENLFSLWNRYQISRRVAAGVGIVYRSEVFAAIDNTVVLPGYTRADAAGYFQLSQAIRLQLNVENLFNAAYFANADNNTNISPGSPRAVRLGLTTSF